MTAPSRNSVVHRLNLKSGEVTWCGIRGPWQEESRPIEQVREFWTDTERYWDSSLGEQGGWAERAVRREGLVGQRVSWYAYQDQVATDHLNLVTCPRCLDAYQRMQQELEQERRLKVRKRAKIVVAIIAAIVGLPFALGLILIVVGTLFGI